VLDVTDVNFQQVVEESKQYPVIIILWAPSDAANAEVAADLAALADEAQGRFLVGRVDVQEYPAIAQAFQVTGVPTVVALLAGQPAPLFAGKASREQMADVLSQVLAAAAQNGITGVAPAQTGVDGEPAEPAEPEVPPLHLEAYEAIERGDLPAAEAAFELAHKQDPKDEGAVAGLAQVRMMIRTTGADPVALRQAADAAPADVDAALAAADADMSAGQVDDAFARLLGLMPGADAETKETLRVRLVSYFEIIGQSDPRVAKARQRLALYLY
jgi:putative thioredoxin